MLFFFYQSLQNYILLSVTDIFFQNGDRKLLFPLIRLLLQNLLDPTPEPYGSNSKTLKIPPPHWRPFQVILIIFQKCYQKFQPDPSPLGYRVFSNGLEKYLKISMFQNFPPCSRDIIKYSVRPLSIGQQLFILQMAEIFNFSTTFWEHCKKVKIEVTGTKKVRFLNILR